MTKKKLSKVIFKISKNMGFNNLCYMLNKGRKRILMYHNIIPDNIFDDSINLEYSIRESCFRKHIDFIGKRFNLGTDLENSNEITLTFDDGYLNQYKIGSKILDEKNIKGYFFCSEDLINNDRVLCIDNIQLWFDYVPYGKYKIFNLELNIEIFSKNDRAHSWSKIHDLIVNNNISMEDIENSLDKTYSFDDIKLNEEFYNLRFKSISKEDIKQMIDKNHKIGAHSSKHNILSNMNIEELEKDIKICGENIGNIYNTDVFCYPFGTYEDVSKEVIDIVRKNKFTKGLASINTPSDSNNYSIDFIPRIDISKIESEEHIDFILSGARHLIKHKRLLPRV